MKKIVILLVSSTALLLGGCGVKSETVCTSEPATSWMDQADFQAQLVAQGYTINKFKVTEGQCYEIYGYNQEGQKVEIYFNPVTGEKVKEEIE
jgi:hypothetical protein